MGVVLIASACAVHYPFVPAIEDPIDWHISEGCRIYQYGILSDPGCDILTGKGIAIQISRIRILSLHPGADDRTTIGIKPQRDDWYFSSPYAALEIAGREYISSEIDEVLVFERQRQSFVEKLEARQQRYRLPLGEKRFFRLRFAVPQAELSNGFALRLTGLHRHSAAVSIPILNFK